MVQVQVTIRFKDGVLELHSNLFRREDATEKEVELGQAMDQLHHAAFKDLIEQAEADGGTGTFEVVPGTIEGKEKP